MTFVSRLANLSVERVNRIPRELKLFAGASLVMGAAYSMFDSIFNNFLDQRFAISPFQRSFLEFPRELPGFLVVFISAALWFLCSRRLAVVCMLLCAAGVTLISFASPGFYVMLLWLFCYSMGQHLYMPLASAIGMELAREGQTGRRLGQLNAIRNAAAIGGSFMVVLGFRSLGFHFNTVFILAAIGLVIAASLMFAMKPTPTHKAGAYLQLHKEYKLYYILAVISGARKQIFITFAPWVLVKIFNQPTEIMASLYLAGGIIGIIFQPLLGWAIDTFGERFVLASEAVILVFICFGYGTAKFLLPEGVAFPVVVACYLIDQMVFSVSMARSTYIKKIAKQPQDVQPALTASVTIDHVFSISAALVGGLIWDRFGFQYVFIFGMGIALLNLIAALQVKIPKKGLYVYHNPNPNS
jgi:predicted MFS family arabinose efflux permease